MSSDRSHSSGYSLPLVAFGAFLLLCSVPSIPPPQKKLRPGISLCSLKLLHINIAGWVLHFSVGVIFLGGCLLGHGCLNEILLI